MLMGMPTAQEALKFNSILIYFSEASSTTINLEKSQFFFFNTPIDIQRHISLLLGIPRSSLPSNYLGIPLSEYAPRNIS
jgi:hypothetical protein